MKKSNSNKIRLGVFVTIGLALFIVGIYFIGEKQQLFSHTFQISGIFKDISGLQIGNNVRFSGINVGVVDDIQIVADTSVKVDLIIDEDARKFIKKDARAVISSDGLMGNKIMVIIPGTIGEKEIQNNDVIATAVPVSLDEIMLKLKITSANAASITDDLSAIMANIRAGKGTMGKFLMDSTFADNIEQTLINLKQGTGGFKQNMDAAGHSFLLRGFLKKKEKDKAEKAEEKDKEKSKEKKK
jgi:phospholipid/cholesterol/gamma-HCH transport system substrate-binding protein